MICTSTPSASAEEAGKWWRWRGDANHDEDDDGDAYGGYDDDQRRRGDSLGRDTRVAKSASSRAHTVHSLGHNDDDDHGLHPNVDTLCIWYDSKPNIHRWDTNRGERVVLSGPNTNSIRIRIQILFGFRNLTESECYLRNLKQWKLGLLCL